MMSISLLLTPAALAATLQVPQTHSTLAAALADAEAGDVIELDPNGQDANGDNWLYYREQAITVTKDVDIIGVDSVPVKAPDMTVFNAAVRLENLSLTSGTSFAGNDIDGDGQDDPLSAALIASGAELTLVDVLLDGADQGDSVIVLDGALYVEGLTARDFIDQRPVYLFSLGRSGLYAELSGLDFEDNAAGGLHADASFREDVMPMELVFDGSLLPATFTRNSEAEGGALRALDVEGLYLYEVEFLGDSASVRGGALHAEGFDELIAEGVRVSGYDADSELFVSGDAAAFSLDAAGGAGLAYFADLTLEGAYVREPVDLGGAITAQDVTLEILGLTASDIEASGGGLLGQRGGSLALESFEVTNFTITGQGALLRLHDVMMDDSVGFTLRHGRICAGDVTGDAGASLLDMEASEVWADHLVVHALTGLRSPVIRATDSAVELVHSTFVYNEDSTLVELHASALSLVNNLLKSAAVGVDAVDAASAVSGGHNLWFALSQGEVTGPGSAGLPGDGAVFADPALWEGFIEGDCAASPWLGPSSPAIDAGAVTDFGDDPDGSPPDIGAYGGADAERPPDADGDGWDVTTDCDDSDPRVNPGAEELLDDGIDNDCDGVAERSGDSGLDDSRGHSGDSAHTGGDTGWVAQDDTQAEVGPPARTRTLGGGCGVVGGGPLWAGGLVLLMVGLARRRR